jgi:hypothetical protein
VGTSRDLTLNIYGTLIPALALEDFESHWKAGKIHIQMGKVNFDPLTINFVVDSQLSNWLTLCNWIFYINNNKDKLGEMPKESAIDASLIITDNFNKEIKRVTFRNVWIQQLGEITLNMREGENTLESSATFLYDRYEIG